MTDFLSARRRIKSAIRLRDSSPAPEWLLDPAQLIDGAILKGIWEPCSTLACERLVKPGW